MAIIKEYLARAASKEIHGMTWQQTIDLVCTMLCIADRHIIIDSARAVVYLRWRQLNQPHEMTIPFNDIVAAINLDATAVNGGK